MDTNGISPLHHDLQLGGHVERHRKRRPKPTASGARTGAGWQRRKAKSSSRFTLYKDMKHVSSREWVVTGQEYVCTAYDKKGRCTKGRWQDTGYYDETITSFASWQGVRRSKAVPL